MRLDEKYRPATFQDVVGQDKAVARIRRALTAGEQVFWLSGQSGTGKTTLSRIIAGEHADKFNTVEIVGRQLTVNMIRELLDRWKYVAMGEKDGYTLIVNESHGLSRPVVEVLLDVLENLPASVLVIFTTTKEGQLTFEEMDDSGPFASRCTSITVTPRGLCPLFARRAKEIAQTEDLDGKPIEDYEKLLKRCGNNMRMALKEIANGTMLAE